MKRGLGIRVNERQRDKRRWGEKSRGGVRVDERGKDEERIRDASKREAKR